jgi:predicted TIM-barrel fold metal-dependent hydrolase
MSAGPPVNTKLPYRIDVHHHVLPKFYVETLEKVGSVMTTLGGVLPDWSLETHLEVMDKNKIAVGMASIPVGIYFESDASARDLARQSNEFLASLRSEHPTRFGAFAVLPVPDVEGALREAAYALDALKLDGVVMLSNVGGHYVGAPENDELFAELNRRNTVVYVHPGDPPAQGIPARDGPCGDEPALRWDVRPLSEREVHLLPLRRDYTVSGTPDGARQDMGPGRGWGRPGPARRGARWCGGGQGHRPLAAPVL